MAAILLDNELFGSGVILNSRWILTTAYTVDWWNPNKLSFRIGSTESEDGGQIFTVDYVVAHKNFTGSWDNDVAVVKLNKPIKFGKNAKPIKLGTENLKAGTKGLIAGWGESSESEFLSNQDNTLVTVLHHSQSTTHTLSHRNLLFTHWIQEQAICLVHAAGGVHAISVGRVGQQ
ncbi:hypothetical protein J6590_059496 [Homalodisca vitripennis]|nr:hypothetical protein J6590_059496 [Homalodisca vitripennis]